MRAPGKSLYRYGVYGLTVCSEFPFPELTAGDAGPEVVVRLCGPAESLPGAGPTWICCNALGRFTIRERREVLVEPRTRVEAGKLRAFLLDRVLPELLRLRGCLLLHASGVAVDGGVIAFAGPTGLGKSTLAAVLHARGHRVVADDLIPVDAHREGGPAVHAGVPELQLLPDALAFLGSAPEPCPPSWRGTAKYPHRVATCFPGAPLPLLCIYLLSEKAGAPSRLPGPGEAILELVRNSYGARWIQGNEALVSHFHQCTTLAARVPILRLERPGALQELPALARRIERAHEPARSAEPRPRQSLLV